MSNEMTEVKVEKLPPGLEAQQKGQVCGQCRWRFPNETPVMLVIPPTNNQIVRPNQMKALPVCLCSNAHSPKYQSILGINASCPAWADVPEPEKVAVPNGTAKKLLVN